MTWCPDVNTGECYCMECERPCGCPPGPCLQPDHECVPKKPDQVISIEQYQKWRNDALERLTLDHKYLNRWPSADAYINAYIGARIAAAFKERK